MNSRRNFLQKLTGSLVALPLLSKQGYLERFKDLTNKPYDGPLLRVAIMGLGSYGTRVADAMKDCTKAKLDHQCETRIIPGRIKLFQTLHLFSCG